MARDAVIRSSLWTTLLHRPRDLAKHAPRDLADQRPGDFFARLGLRLLHKGKLSLGIPTRLPP
jgi:hypothetical protein